MTEENALNMSDDEMVSEFERVSIKLGPMYVYQDLEDINFLTLSLHSLDRVLRVRGSSARLKLARLLDSEIASVRFEAAQSLYALLPEQCRAVLEALVKRGPPFLSGSAGMTLYYIDNGIVKPT